MVRRRPRLSGRERYDARRSRRSMGPPTWFDEDTSPCECSEEERETTTLRSYTGYSDFFYAKVRCETCGETWCYWIEG